MIDKMKALPKKIAFTIGIILILVSPILLFLMSELFSFSVWTSIIIQGFVYGVAAIFIISAADERHSRIDRS
ncbi:hypothetical protein CUC15_07290 [Oceanobacillus zhaokaii]|uniref:Uncharacterized protein n=1 Tax=Oceanobacillus zhaokaii TaxID=2052660 RepID=A0A345PFF0_9BACI|nr:hypothetical protein CUC15_07290 [Oceanobacillus zhaokaii]